MSFELARIEDELAAAPMFSPIPLELAVAIVDDTLRMAGMMPIAEERWPSWRKKGGSAWEDRLGVLAHLLAHTSMRDASVDALRAHDPPFAKNLVAFFGHVEPLAAEMVRANAMRREEFVRRWAQACGASIPGETREQSAARLDQLDYRKTMAEYAAAEEARKAEAERRRKLLEEAAAAEAAARGWRE